MTNEDYVEGLTKRDPKLLNHIYREFFPGIAQYVRNGGGQEADAEDVFQEGLIVLYRKAASLELSSSFYTYFFAVCKRIWWKKRGKSKELPMEELVIGTDMAELEVAIQETERLQLLRDKLAQLDEGCRKLLELFFQGMKMANVAQEMGFNSIGYAKKRKFLCKQRLVEMIKQDVRYRELSE